MSSEAPVCDGDVCAVPSKTTASAVEAKSDAATTVGGSEVKKIKVDITSDAICPWCYVGKRRLEKAIRQLDSNKVKVEVEWHPFQLDPTLPAPGKDKLTHYQTKFGKERTAAMLPHMKAVGKEDGINFSYGGKVGNTVNAHRLVEFAKRENKQDEMMNALMAAYFENEQDVSDVDTLAKLAAKVGIDEAKARAFLATDEFRRQVEVESMRAAAGGVSGVPHFTIGGKYSVSGAQSPDYFLQVFKKLGVA